MFHNVQLSWMDWNSYCQLFWQVFHCLKGFFTDELNRLSEPPTHRISRCYKITLAQSQRGDDDFLRALQKLDPFRHIMSQGVLEGGLLAPRLTTKTNKMFRSGLFMTMFLFFPLSFPRNSISATYMYFVVSQSFLNCVQDVLNAAAGFSTQTTPTYLLPTLCYTGFCLLKRLASSKWPVWQSHLSCSLKVFEAFLERENVCMGWGGS